MSRHKKNGPREKSKLYKGIYTIISLFGTHCSVFLPRDSAASIPVMEEFSTW